MKTIICSILLSLVTLISGCNIGGWGAKLPGGCYIQLLDKESGTPITLARLYGWGYLFEPAAALQLGIIAPPQPFMPGYISYVDNSYCCMHIYKNTPGVVYIMTGPEHIKNKEFSKIVHFSSKDINKGILTVYLTKEEQQ